jgi:hypothetical protein
MENGRMTTRHPRPTVRPYLIVLAAVILLGVLASVPLGAHAATTGVNCSNARADRDADGDGISDKDECQGITLNLGTAAPVSIPKCPGTSPFGCLDPNRKDLFVILVPAATSLIPSSPFEFVAKPTAAPDLGLGITIHQITNANAGPNTTTCTDISACDRLLTGSSFGSSTVRAVRVTENPADLTSGTILGQAANGTPTTTGRVVIWSVRILQHINEVRAAASPTRLPALIGTEAIVVNYIKQVIAHEMGHVMGPMANVDSTTASLYGGAHYAPADVVVMSQYVTNDGAGNFLIPDDFTNGDRSALRLK